MFLSLLRRRVNQKLYERAVEGFRFPDTDRDVPGHPDLVAGGAFCAYVHFPFCASVCRYCAFSRTLDMGLAHTYCESVLREIDLFRATRASPGARLTSVYFGGGTPSLIPLSILEKICSRLLESFAPAPGLCMTLECNPESLDPAHVDAYLKMGIRRLSVGIQSLHPAVLHEMGRASHPERFIRTLRALPEKGMPNFGVDLMYGFAAQDRETFLSDIKRIMECGAEHVTLYPLVTSSKGPSRGDRQRECRQNALYECGRQAFRDSGFVQYSTEDFVRDLQNRDPYEMDCWMIPPRDMVVFGTAGFGSLNHHFYTKERSIERYTESIAQGEFPIASAARLQTDKEALSRLLSGLRYLSIDRFAFRERYGIDPVDGCAVAVKALKKAGLISVEKHALRLREDGYFPYSLLWAKVMLAQLNGNLVGR